MENNLILDCAGHFEFEHDPDFLPNGEAYKIHIAYDDDEPENFVITILVDGVVYKTLIDEDLSHADLVEAVLEIVYDMKRSEDDH